MPGYKSFMLPWNLLRNLEKTQVECYNIVTMFTVRCLMPVSRSSL
jgi:hypothetical protein